MQSLSLEGPVFPDKGNGRQICVALEVFYLLGLGSFGKKNRDLIKYNVHGCISCSSLSLFLEFAMKLTLLNINQIIME